MCDLYNNNGKLGHALSMKQEVEGETFLKQLEVGNIPLKEIETFFSDVIVGTVL
jgi:hypothetical protein